MAAAAKEVVRGMLDLALLTKCSQSILIKAGRSAGEVFCR